MKGQRVCAVLLCTAMMTSVLSGCVRSRVSSALSVSSDSATDHEDSSAKEEERDQGTGEQETDETKDTENAETTEDLALYAPLLEDVTDALRNGDYGNNSYVMNSLSFKLGMVQPDALLRDCGYIITDINGDDIPELLIGENNYIYAGYTLKDEQIVCFLDCPGVMDNNACFYGGGDVFYRTWLSEAGTCLEISILPENTTELIRQELYYLNYDGQRDDFVFYHKTFGENGSETTEELDEDTYWNILNQYKARYVTLQMTTLADYSGANSSGGIMPGSSQVYSKDEILALYEETKQKDAEIELWFETEATGMMPMREKASERYELWETFMNALLAYFEANLPDAEWNTLKAEQQTWSDEAEAIAEEHAAEYEGGTAYPLELSLTFSDEMKTRAEVLMQRVD